MKPAILPVVLNPDQVLPISCLVPDLTCVKVISRRLLATRKGPRLCLDIAAEHSRAAEASRTSTRLSICLYHLLASFETAHTLGSTYF